MREIYREQSPLADIQRGAVLVVQKMQPVLANTDAWMRSTDVA
ncbi:MAG TPA: hypothetical protein VGP95_08125 [Gemmatimonadaceae bacterium]|jgi:hypothetical protein|nr:hypothetical protein [Gemmatimonadaceae bacterium]